MLEQLTPRCDRCDRELTEDRRMLSMVTVGGTRHAYECDCGDVIITISE